LSLPHYYTTDWFITTTLLTPIIYQLHLKRRCFVAGYVQPVIQQHEINSFLKKASAIKVAAMKITDNFHYELMEATTKLTLFTVSKDEGGTGKSTKKAFYVQWPLVKGISWAE